MKLEINENSEIVLKKVYNAIHLVTKDKEKISICMRDEGFEFWYNNEHYQAKSGEIDKLSNFWKEDAREKLSVDYLLSVGFVLVDNKDVFENYSMPYYVKNGVILFFNEPINEFNDTSFLIGFANQHFNKYSVVCLRWISTITELKQIYENTKFEKLIPKN